MTVSKNQKKGDSNPPRKILVRLKSKKYETVERALREVVKKEILEAIPHLIHLLKTTDDHGIRNQTALALSDLRSEEGAEAIKFIIRAPSTRDHRGSLIYALRVFDCRDFLYDLVELLSKGNYEEKGESFCIIRDMKGKIDSKIKQKSIKKLREIISDLESMTEAFHELVERMRKNNRCENASRFN